MSVKLASNIGKCFNRLEVLLVMIYLFITFLIRVANDKVIRLLYELLLKIKTGAYFRKKLQNIQNIHADQLLFDM